MRPALLIILVAFPLLELALLIKLGQLLGFWMAWAYILSTAAIGGIIIYMQGTGALVRAFDSTRRGQMPLEPVVDGAFLIIAGALLLAPGVITDACGLLLLVPAIRRQAARWSVDRLLQMADVRVTGSTPEHAQASVPDGPIIEGEFKRIDETTVDPRGDTRRRRA